MKVSDTFWSNKRIDENGCWNWTRAVASNGYGHFSMNGKTIPAHRMAWTLTHGEIPTGLCVLHRCDNRLCFNPDHLFLGTKSDNSLDASRKGRRFEIPKSCMKRGEDHGIAKLSNAQVRSIYTRYTKKEVSAYRLAKEYGVCVQTICNIVKGKTWAHVTQGIQHD